MASLRVMLHSKTYNDSTRAVMLQLIYETLAGRQFRRKTICRIDPKYWNARTARIKAGHPNYVALNQTINSVYNPANDRLLDLQRKGLLITGETVFEEQRDQTGLIGAAEAYIERMRGRGSYHSAEKYESHVNRIRQFRVHPRPLTESEPVVDISLDEVTEDWILRFARWLKEHHVKSDNTLKKRMQFLGAIFRDARKRGLTQNDPLAMLEFPRTKAKKPALTAAQIDDLARLELTGHLALTRDTFLLQFYLYGSRISDVLLLRPRDVLKSRDSWRIEYEMYKTGAQVSIPLRPEVRAIVERYYDEARPYLLPWMHKVERADFTLEQNAKWVGDQVESCSAMVNKYLKELAVKAEIPVNLTTHIARHTFARLADKTVADKRKISKALRHSKFSMTEEYLEELRMSDLDEDMAAVYG